MADQTYQSLYRQYRPQRFAEVRGQEHVTKALRNAVRSERAGHAYLFTGPRGTGKTSTARILAKALNCTALDDGEPCGQCPSCVAVQAGSSLDVIELDAASNNGVEAMRDLVSRAALGSPGRWKVYIVDEVHMLTPGASNALLKTLEEPPGHVVFVLATTDPQKVLPTVQSRTQKFDFHLLASDVLGGLVRDVNAAAGLGLDPEALERVARKGNGSARDALSFLDQVAAAGEVADDTEVSAAIVEALCATDVGQALQAVASGAQSGRDPRRIAVEVVERLRDAFLATMAPSLANAVADDIEVLADQAKRLGTPALVRAMEVLGESLVTMREALDTRVTLEVALVRLCSPEADTSPAALLERVDRLERRFSAGAPALSSSPPPTTAPTPGPVGPLRPAAPAPAGTVTAETPAVAAPALVGQASGVSEPGMPGAPTASRAALGAIRRDGGPRAAARSAPASSPPESSGAPAGSTGSRSRPDQPGPERQRRQQPLDTPSDSQTDSQTDAASQTPRAVLDRDELTKAWGDGLLANLPPGARAVFRVGRWLSVDHGTATFAVPNGFHRDRADGKRRDVETALRAHFGARLAISVVVDPDDEVPQLVLERDTSPLPLDDDITSVDLAQMQVAKPPAASTVEDRVKQAFPGAEEVPE